MTVTISIALLLGVTVILLCKYGGLKIGHAAVCIIFGLYLASTSFGPYITQFIDNLFRR